MKWIDQNAYTCARTWSESCCVTVYVGGIRFYSPISVEHLIKVDAYVLYTGNTSIHVGIGGYSKDISKGIFEKKTHCIIVFVAVDEDGNPIKVRKWVPSTQEEYKFEE